MARTLNWLARYQAGEEEAVWAEFRLLGGEVRHPDLIDEVRAVCDEMARRARANIELLVQRLSAQGFRFHRNDDEMTPLTPHIAPTSVAGELADWLVEFFGVPLAIESWIRHVGDTWLVGTHPSWPQSPAADPLVIQIEGAHYGQSTRSYFEEDFEAWSEDPAGRNFVLPLAPDAYHKDNVSGGEPYGVVVPDSSAEGIWVGERTQPFVEYLNEVFQNGGFPSTRFTTSGQLLRRELAVGMLTL